MKRATPGRDVPPLYQGIAAAATRSRANAMKLFCLECVGYVRQDVTDCTASKCPLFRWRPYQDGRGEQEEIILPARKQGAIALERDLKGRLLPKDSETKREG